MKNRHNLIVMILAWTILASLVIPPAHANVTKNIEKGLTISHRRLLNKVREQMDKKEYTNAIALIRADKEKTANKASTSGSGPENTACTHPLVCLALGNCYLMVTDYPSAESAYLAALKLAPDFMDARINLAKVYSDSSQLDKAAQAFLAAYERSDPRQPDYLYYCAAMTLASHQAEAAVGHFENLFTAHPDQVVRRWQENFANALMTANHWEKAIPLVRELAAQATGKEKIRWQETLLQIYLQNDNLKQALAYATELSRKDCTLAKWWKALVHVQLGLGHYSQALDDLIVYGFISPLTWEEKKLLADLSLQLKIPTRAINTYETILAEANDAPMDAKDKRHITLQLVNAYRLLGNGDKALALLNRVDSRGCDPEILMLKGDLLYEAKAFKSANKAYRMAARGGCPKKGQAWLMAGYAAWQHNDIKGSRSAFKKAALFKRHRKDALAAIARLERTTPM